MAKAKATPPAVTKTPPAKESAPPAPEKTQEHAGAGESQGGPILSGKNGPDPVIALRVTAAREGFRRAGRAWSKQPTVVPVAELTNDEVAALMAEPMLTVEEVVL